MEKNPTKQDLFNGEKIIFSTDTVLLRSIGARSSMSLMFAFETNVDLFFFFFFFFFYL